MSMSRKGPPAWIRPVLASSIFLLLMGHATAAAAQFPSREAAVAALTQAVEDRDSDRVAGLLGPEYGAFQEGQEADAALAEARAERFLTSFREFHGFVALEGGRQILVVGAEAWPFPSLSWNPVASGDSTAPRGWRSSAIESSEQTS